MTALPAEISAGGATWFITPRSWEIEFFGRQIASLQWRSDLPDRTPTEWLGGLQETVAAADDAGVELLETNLDAAEFQMVPRLEAVGFRLVDSRVRFFGRMTVHEIPTASPRIGHVADAAPEDKGRIVELTHACLTDNDGFMSRFKNRDYFTYGETRRYYTAWVENTAFADDARTAVYVVDDRVAGFYTYQVSGKLEALPVLKVIITGVEHAARGNHAHLAMQAHLYRAFGFDEWYVDNVTQLANLPVIRSHSGAGKRIESIHLTYYRKGAAR